MKKTPILFLQTVVVLVGLAALVLMVWLPSVEGRAKNLDWMGIYTDPFILYGYAVSIAFFVALYKAFVLLGHIGQHKLFSTTALNALRSIKYCATALGVGVVAAGIYIKLLHSKEDDPAGFLALCMVITFISVVVATAVAVLEKILRNAVEMKSENDLTI